MQGEWHAFYDKPEKARIPFRAFGRVVLVITFLEVSVVLGLLILCGVLRW